VIYVKLLFGLLSVCVGYNCWFMEKYGGGYK